MNQTDFKKLKLPDSPGVYFFKKGTGKNAANSSHQKNAEILYIGKATSLRDRVRSYFGNDLINTRGPLIVDMVTQADTVTFEKTDSVLEALILESALIKKHQPIYNTKEKDNKSYNSVVITDEKIPRVLVGRDREIKSGEFETRIGAKIAEQFGPFPSAGQLEEALKIIQKIFPFFNTKKPVTNFTERDKNRIGLNIQIGLYPDLENIDLKEYSKNIKNIRLFFEGKKTAVLRRLEKDMQLSAKNQEFEKANNIKKTIFALDHINDVALIKEKENQSTDGNFRIESYDIAHMSGKNTVGAMIVFKNGQPKKSEYKKFIIRDAKPGDDYGALAEILERRAKHAEWNRPDLIVIDGGKGQLNMAKKTWRNSAEKDWQKIPIISVVKDDKHKAREILAKDNLSKILAKKYEREILAINEETHRFTINYYRQKQRGMLK
jgi:excinuclease ABC subunit C